MSTVMNIRVPEIVDNLLTRWATVSFQEWIISTELNF
jgi:hypothetical protein